MACQNCEQTAVGPLCSNQCDPAQNPFSKDELLENAFRKAVAAGERPESVRAQIDARHADIALITYHMGAMNGEDFQRAEKTLFAIQNGQRRYDTQLKRIARRAA